jgi:hypothetical protein
MSGVVSSGCCCAEGCGDCCDFFSCSPTTPFTIELSGNWVSQETFSPSGQVITTGEIHWTITATMTRIGSDCSTYRYYANTCEFSYEYITRRWSAGGNDMFYDGSGPFDLDGFTFCTRYYRFDLDGDMSYYGKYLTNLEYSNDYGSECWQSACPCWFAPINLTTGTCSCSSEDSCGNVPAGTASCGRNSSGVRHTCQFWNCTSYASGYSDDNACNGFTVKAAADILLKVVKEETWTWNATLQGRPATYCPPGSGNLCNTGLDNGDDVNCPNHQNYWVPGSVITIACKRNCNPDCDSPILIFNPNPAQVVTGVYTDDNCMSPCVDMGCEEPTVGCSSSFNVNLPPIFPWVIFGSGDCLNGDTFDEPITSQPSANPAGCGPGPANRWSDDLPSVVFYSLTGGLSNLEPPNMGNPGGGGQVLNMCGVDQYCSLLDRTYVEKRVTYADENDVSGHTYPGCCTADNLAHTERTECTYFDPVTQTFVTVDIDTVVCDKPVPNCPDFPEFTGTTDHTITWGFRFI